jgi:serine/threonine protein kinase
MLVGQPPFIDEDPMGIYQQILAGKVHFPKNFDKSAKSLVKKLLVSDLTKRLGCLKNSSSDIKNHKWFTNFDWINVLNKTTQAPLIPLVQSDSDTSNFDLYTEDSEIPETPSFGQNRDPFENF